MPLLIVLLLFFALELGLFIEWGSEIGVVATLLLIVATAILGTQVIRFTGLKLVQELQQVGMGNGIWLHLRQQTMMRRMLGGLLLIIPGFATDLVGVAFVVWSLFGPRGPRTPPGGGHRPESDESVRPSGRVIEGDYERDN